jgi:Domain of unknown function (DUF1841)
MRIAGSMSARWAATLFFVSPKSRGRRPKKQSRGKQRRTHAGSPSRAFLEREPAAQPWADLTDEQVSELAPVYAPDLLDAGFDGDALRAALARRIFAMPQVRAPIDGEWMTLDPVDEDERSLLIAAEHPEYRGVLDDPLAEGDIDGVNPRLHVAMHQVVTNQLWDDDPPETWRAAQRLLATGMDRHDVLHQLAGAVTHSLHQALTTQQPVDQDAYRAALDALAPTSLPDRDER